MDSISLSSSTSSSTTSGASAANGAEEIKEQEIKELTADEIATADIDGDGVVTEQEFKAKFGNVSSSLLLECLQKYNSSKSTENNDTEDKKSDSVSRTDTLTEISESSSIKITSSDNITANTTSNEEKISDLKAEITKIDEKYDAQIKDLKQSLLNTRNEEYKRIIQAQIYKAEEKRKEEKESYESALNEELKVIDL